MNDIANELHEFEVLGVDCKSIVEAQDVVEALEKLIQESTQALFKLRPGAKDYQAQLSELQARTNAYQAQLEGARADLQKAIYELKEKVVTNAGDYQQDYHGLRALDVAIVEALLQVRELVIQRAQATVEFDKKRAILDRYNHETSAGTGLRDSRTPWLKTFPTPWGNALRAYIERFLALAGNSGDGPGDGDALEWFGKRL